MSKENKNKISVGTKSVPAATVSTRYLAADNFKYHYYNGNPETASV